MTRSHNGYVYRGSYAVVGGQNLNCDRISVRAHVRLPASEIDPRTGMLLPPRPTQQRNPRSQRQPAEKSEAMPVKPVQTKQVGISLRRAVALMAALACLLGFVSLTNYGHLTQQSKAVGQLLDEIAGIEKETQDYRTTLADMLKDSELCYNASQKLGMISSKGVSTVYLTAQAPAPVTVTQADAPPARTGIYAALFGFME